MQPEHKLTKGLIPRDEAFSPLNYGLFALATALTALLSMSLGSVPIPLPIALDSILSAIRGNTPQDKIFQTILLTVRLPRVLCVGLVGASLSLCGASMQGLLRNPLADGSTLGVSSGASLGECSVSTRIQSKPLWLMISDTIGLHRLLHNPI